MSKEINKLIPELRFPEFKNEGEWEEKELKNLGQFFGGGTPERSNSDYWIGHIPWISSSDIAEDDIQTISITRFINENAIKESATKIIPKGSVLFVSRVGVGKLAINKEEICTSQDFTNFLPVNNILNFFIGYYFSSNKNLLQSLNQGTSIKGFSKSDLESFKLPYPKNPQEQQKIASCLSSLDEVISAHSQKLDLLKDHKKGLMQNLFPQEGGKVPKYRFKEFEKDGEWVEKKLGEVAEIITGNTPSTAETAYYGGDKMFVSPADINDNRIVSKTKSTLTQLGFSKTRQIKAGSVLFVCIGSTIGKIAQNKYECATNQQLNSLIANTGYSNDFLYSLLDGNSTGIASIAGNHAVPIINKTSFSDVKLYFPPSFQEQQKIASCLSSLDALITAQSEKIAQLKLHKKGLMQGLFPKMSEHD